MDAARSEEIYFRGNFVGGSLKLADYRKAWNEYGLI